MHADAFVHAARTLTEAPHTLPVHRTVSRVRAHRSQHATTVTEEDVVGVFIGVYNTGSRRTNAAGVLTVWQWAGPFRHRAVNRRLAGGVRHIGTVNTPALHAVDEEGD